MKKIIILLIFLPIIFGLFIIYKNYKIVKAQSLIGIEIYALNIPSSQDLGIKLERATNNDPYAIYKTHPFSTVASGTPFRMILKNTRNEEFDFKITSGNYTFATSTKCENLGGYTSSSNCIIEGLFNNPSGNYSFVTFIYRKGGVSASTSIFIVDPIYGGRNTRIPNRQDQFLLEPRDTTTEPTSTITYTIYNNKAYCTSSLVSSARSEITPATSGFGGFNVDSGGFGNGFVTRDLTLKGVSRGNYSLSLKSNNNQVSLLSTIRVSLGDGVSPPLPPSPPSPSPPSQAHCPPGSQAYNPSTNICYRCFFGYCQYWNPSEQRWVTTSNSACEGVGLRCRAGGVRE